jgi:hypothetical protein
VLGAGAALYGGVSNLASPGVFGVLVYRGGPTVVLHEVLADRFFLGLVLGRGEAQRAEHESPRGLEIELAARRRGLAVGFLGGCCGIAERGEESLLAFQHLVVGW